ncbi:hypothetical protein C4J81_14710 [Deltaproteobacteria bacterium Smac51]|nr:hypothetical protein C4J81_14710 [Deltaproteobacteria bacterium Smac51]
MLNTYFCGRRVLTLEKKEHEALKCPLTGGPLKQWFGAPPDKPYLEVKSVVHTTRPYEELSHHAFSIGVIIEGECLFRFDQTDCLVRAGEMVLIEGGRPYSSYSADGGCRSYHLLHLEPSWCLENIEDAPPGHSDMTVIRRVIREPQLFASLLWVLEAVCCDHFYDGMEFGRIIGSLIKSNCRLDKPSRDFSEVHSKINKAREIIHNQVECPMRVMDLARMVGLGREGFIRSFQKSVGVSPGIYQHCVRLLEARRLLGEGASIAEAALATGYVDQSHFHRMFVKFFASTPRQYTLRKSGQQPKE